jgi:Cu/Ag efflux pump CusA
VLTIRRFQDVRQDGGEASVAGLVRLGARERLAPLLTTAAAVAAAALPFVVLGSGPGLEIVHPLAVVLLGGLVTSMFVALFVLPAVYLKLGAGGRELEPEDEEHRRPEGHGAPAQPVDKKGAVT